MCLCSCAARPAGRKPLNRIGRGKPWLRDLAISFVTDVVDPTCILGEIGTSHVDVYRRGVGGRCVKISLARVRVRGGRGALAARGGGGGGGRGEPNGRLRLPLAVRGCIGYWVGGWD